jgi:FAD synthetase
MKTVLATGVFDLLHPGHLHYLEQARNLGDRLVVVIAADITAKKMKRHPVMPAADRAQMVGALRIVDEVYIGDEHDRLAIVHKIKPDIIALGYDQRDDPHQLMQELATHGIQAHVVRLQKAGGYPRATSHLIEIAKKRI